MTPSEPLLELRGVSRSFPGVQALDAFDFDLRAGEIHCLVGENGAGKSTFIKILSGAISPESGTLRLFGTDRRFLTPSQAIRSGIQTVYQESALVPSLSVAENIHLGQELAASKGPWRSWQVDRHAQVEQTRALLSSLEIRIAADALVEDLSSAERQLVGLARALSRDARILVLDEPTASLSATESRTLLTLLRSIASRGVGIIYISHYLEEVLEIADRVTVLKDGRRVGLHTRDEVDQQTLVREMVGRDASSFYNREDNHAVQEGPPFLRMDSYSRRGSVHDVSLDVRRGEIFGLGGMIGAGRTELVRLLFGVDRRDSGRLTLDGVDITPDSPRDALRHGLCLITEDRQHSGLVLIRSVKENVSLARISLQRSPVIDLKEENRLVNEMVAKLRVATPSLAQEIRNLSGGNQQKAILARWLLTEGRVFLFDEPTRGIDIGAKQEIYRLMVELVRGGAAIIMVSSDMPELIAMSDRVGVMRDGRLVKVLEGHEITEESVLAYAIGSNAA